MVAQTRTGVIMDLTDRPKENCHQLGTTNQCIVRNQVFGLNDEMPLSDIFERMFQLEKGQPARVKPKASKEELESYFFEVFQDYDEDRVHASDIKKSSVQPVFGFKRIKI